jgi:hypothetical protein
MKNPFQPDDIRPMLLVPHRLVYDTQHQRLGVVDAVNMHNELYYTNTDREQPHTLYMQHVDSCLPVLTAEERHYLTQLLPCLLNGLHYTTLEEARMSHNARKPVLKERGNAR